MVLKDLFLATMLSLSKTEKQMVRDILEDDLNIKKEYQKHELKLIDKQKFYQILEKADEFVRNRDKDKLNQKMLLKGDKSDGLEIENIFTNKKKVINESVYAIKQMNKLKDSPDDFEYSLKCDNELYYLTDYVHIKKGYGNIKVIELYVNSKSDYNMIENLDSLSIIQYEENNKIWEYQIKSFIDFKPYGEWVIFKFNGILTKNGESTLKFNTVYY
jgi:hypothetical protein